MTDIWRNETNQILYALMSVRDLNDHVAAEMADAMMNGRYFIEGPEAYLNSIQIALDQPDNLTGQIKTPHSEDDLRTFLQLIARHLERGRAREVD